MSTDTKTGTDLVTDRPKPRATSFLVVLAGALVVLVGSVLFFAGSPTISVEPLFDIPAFEPVSVVVNTAVGATLVVAGTAVAVPGLDDLL